MEPEEPAAGLYDFLHRDSGRITSYYAQIFNGHLSSIEQTEAEQSGKKLSGELDVKVASGAFFLRTDGGDEIVGIIKEEGMEEPIPSYYFKHGASGLANVFLIGIKEIPSESFTLPGTQLIGVGQYAAQAMSDVLFPPAAIRVTPVALFCSLTDLAS